MNVTRQYISSCRNGLYNTKYLFYSLWVNVHPGLFLQRLTIRLFVIHAGSRRSVQIAILTTWVAATRGLWRDGNSPHGTRKKPLADGCRRRRKLNKTYTHASYTTTLSTRRTISNQTLISVTWPRRSAACTRFSFRNKDWEIQQLDPLPRSKGRCVRTVPCSRWPRWSHVGRADHSFKSIHFCLNPFQWKKTVCFFLLFETNRFCPQTHGFPWRTSLFSKFLPRDERARDAPVALAVCDSRRYMKTKENNFNLSSFYYFCYWYHLIIYKQFTVAKVVMVAIDFLLLFS